MQLPAQGARVLGVQRPGPERRTAGAPGQHAARVGPWGGPRGGPRDGGQQNEGRTRRTIEVTRGVVESREQANANQAREAAVAEEQATKGATKQRARLIIIVIKKRARLIIVL